MSILFVKHICMTSWTLTRLSICTDTSIDAIIREGFKIGGKDIKKSHGSAYGIGV